AGRAVTNDHYTTKVDIFRGTDLQLISTIFVPQKIYAGFCGPIALVRYPNGNGGMQGAIVLHCYDKKLRSYSPDGQLLATSNIVTPCEGPISVTDFNYDGWPEIYIGNVVYDAATLTRLCAGPANGNMGRSWRGNSNELANNALSFAADILGDSLPELICGNTIYQVDIVSRTNVSLNSVTELKTIIIPSHIPQDGNVAVADFNKDGQLDVMVVKDNTPNDILDSAYIYAYDPVTEEILFVHGHYAKTIGFPMIGDIDGDEDLDFVYIDFQSQVYNSRITAVTFHPSTGLETKWQASHEDESGQTSMTLFDFNQDGIMEIVYRDQARLRIINGSSKSHLTGNDTIPFYNLYSVDMFAGTWKEYPVVADVNGDGRAEVVVCGKMTTGLGWVGGQLAVIGGIHPWAPARPVWNQYLYNVTNVNRDLTIPTPLFDNATAFTDPQGVVRRPFNNFLQQATTLDQYGRPFMTLANATATTDTSITITDNLISLTFRICNTGSQSLNAPFSITYYVDSYQGEILRTETINAMLPPDSCIDWQTSFSNNELLNYPDIQTIVIAINDNGTGVAQNGGQQEECDTTDNFFYFDATACPVRRDTVTADVCVNEAYADDNFDISAAETSTAGTYFFQRIFPIDDCDSVVVLQLRVHPEYDINLTENIAEGASYSNHGLFLSESDLVGIERLDTTLAMQSVTGCDSIINLTIVIAVPDITIYLPNAITPSNQDGLNDYLYIPEKIQSQIDDFEIRIFNRWGELVFYSRDKGFKWYGTYNEKVFHNNVYQYVIHYKNLFGRPIMKKGSITVL
ncbi:MAG: gliding motility-associated C-terminal domain-containing protein, partial [Bacteroidales bacterium]|nr:gliding motility-associated C-terminal domain-containing protein [Bacteroidales bacterium]